MVFAKWSVVGTALRLVLLVTPMLFYRMDFHGIGNDLTRVNAAFAAAVRKRRQLVLLPPLRRFSALLPSLRHLSWQQPWHWLVRVLLRVALSAHATTFIAAMRAPG